MMGWLNRLMEVPEVLIVSADSHQAVLEVAGIEAVAASCEAGLCIGLRFARTPTAANLNRMSLNLQALGSSDDAIALDSGRALLWRLHRLPDSASEPCACSRIESLDSQIALYRWLSQHYHLCDNATSDRRAQAHREEAPWLVR